MAHHLAEILVKAEEAAEPDKTNVEKLAVDTILKLWSYRRVLPEPVDPLRGYRDAIEVLRNLGPEADPWHRRRGDRPYEELLHKTFLTVGRVVLAGIILTQVSGSRTPTIEEVALLAEEERYLNDALGFWERYFTRQVPQPKISVTFVNAAPVDDGEVYDEFDVTDDENLTQPEQESAAITEESAKELVVANLERMQSDLSNLLSRWKSAQNVEHTEAEGNNDQEEAD